MASLENASITSTSKFCVGSRSSDSRASPSGTSIVASLSFRNVKSRRATVEHVGIDLVEAEDVALRTIGRERAGAESDHADLERRRARVQRLEQAPDARRLRVIGGRLPLPVRRQVLRPVQDRAVDQRPAQVRLVLARASSRAARRRNCAWRRSCPRRTRAPTTRCSRRSRAPPRPRARRTRCARRAPARAGAAPARTSPPASSK